MKKNRNHLLLLAFAFMLQCSSSADAVKLPEAIGDDMVLQQNADVKLWGWSKPNDAVKITTSWNGRKYKVKADEKGGWAVKVATPSASYTPYRMTFADAEGEKTVNGILIGEVWFASGQSNMEMPLAGFWTQPIAGSNRAIAYSGKYKGIRMLTVEKTAATEPADSVGGGWKVSCPENAPRFSALGYFFAEALTQMLDVPVGIINCSWGGSHVEGWLPREELEKYTDVDLSQAGSKGVREWDQPLIMYNGMLHPLVGYTVKGFLWNQGESNIGHHDTYPQRLAKMAEIWRRKWGQGDIPFYCVEIPPYSYGDVNGTWAAMLREAQHKAVRLIANSGIVCNSDLTNAGEVEDIHASRKQELGERLAFMAAAKAYGIKGIVCDSPEFKSMDIDGNTVTLHFTNAEDGFTPNRNLEGFEVAGADRVFYPAIATEVYDTRDIKLTCEKVPNIVAVRYCFKNWALGKVHSLRWLPLVPFRTDDWSN